MKATPNRAQLVAVWRMLIRVALEQKRAEAAKVPKAA